MTYDPTKPIDENNIPPFNLDPDYHRPAEPPKPILTPVPVQDITKLTEDIVSNAKSVSYDDEQKALEEQNKLNAMRFESEHSGWITYIFHELGMWRIALGSGLLGGLVWGIVKLKGC